MNQELSMTRQQSYSILTRYLKNPNLLKHCLACEAAMKAVYRHLYKNSIDTQDEKVWGITGLLHDIDYELAKQSNQLNKHGLLIFEKEKDIPEDIAHAIKSHNFENTKVMPENLMDWAITCCDQLTGLIVACTLVHPDRKLASLTPDFIVKRMKEKSFAKGADRKPILMCEEKLRIPLKEFVEINLSAMQSISKELGL
jgi:hypothetical protein